MNFISRTFFPDHQDQKELINSFFRREVYKKKEMLFKNGDSYTRHYLIESGLLRMFVIDTAGKEFNILFAKENQVIGDLSSPVPTKFNVEAIEDTVVYSISSENITKLRDLIDTKTTLSENHIVRAYLFLQNRLVSILTKTAEENFIQLRQDYPDLIKRLPQYHIASYLGISAEFLSKIIAKIAKS